MANSNLHKAKKAKNDEFYTDIQDIARELKHYKDQFKGKHVFLNCDDPEASHFWKFFAAKFEDYGLKQLTATHYHDKRPTYRLDIVGDNNNDGIVDGQDLVKTPLLENGDFRSPESLDILSECDIVVSNPPFSLFREYMEVLQDSGKQFLAIGSKNAITYKECFKYIKQEKLWLGITMPRTFRLPDGTNKAAPAVWYTNMDHKVRNEEIILIKQFTPEDYPTYDNYNAINVNKVVEIPVGYTGAMGVPITYLTKHTPSQFEIIGCSYKYGDSEIRVDGDDRHGALINGVAKYKRLIIKAKGNK